MKLKNQLLIQIKSHLHWLHEYHVDNNFVMSETGHGSCVVKILDYNWLGDCLMGVKSQKNWPLGNRKWWPHLLNRGQLNFTVNKGADFWEFDNCH